MIKKILLVLLVFGGWWGVNLLTSFRAQDWTRGKMAGPGGAVYRRLGELRIRLVTFFKVGNVLEENLWLREENRRWQSAVLQMETLKKENTFLREELGVARQRPWSLIMARIFGFSSDGPWRTVWLDRGAEDGVRVGQAVIFKGDVLLGVVKEVSSRQARIYLVTDPRLLIGVKVAMTEISGQARGAGEKGMFLELVSNQEIVREGQRLVTSGLDGLPRQLVIGQVANVQSRPGELFQTIRVEPLWGDILSEDVLVITD